VVGHAGAQGVEGRIDVRDIAAYSASSDQSQPLIGNIPHRPTNHSPSIAADENADNKAGVRPTIILTTSNVFSV
jgi:hypothetical protein